MNTKPSPLPRSPLAIRVALLRLNISLTEAANYVGVTKSMVSLVLKGKTKSRRVIDDLRELIRERRDGIV